jgi:hypothetical protein
MFNNWANVDYTALAFDAGSMISNGIIYIPISIAEYNQYECEGNCNCPDEDGVVPDVDPEDCDAVVNRFGQGQTMGRGFAKFFNSFVPPVV